MFIKEMTVGEAMQTHPEAGLVFASFHLGGCKSCGVNEMETIEQVCEGYGIETYELLDSLNSLLQDNEEVEV